MSLMALWEIVAGRGRRCIRTPGETVHTGDDGYTPVGQMATDIARPSVSCSLA
jgi:hypothetical protein